MRLSPHWILASFTLAATVLLVTPGCKSVMAKQSSKSAMNTGRRSYGRDRSARNQQETRIAFEDRSLEWGLPPSNYILEKQPKNIEETFIDYNMNINYLQASNVTAPLACKP